MRARLALPDDNDAKQDLRSGSRLLDVGRKPLVRLHSYQRKDLKSNNYSAMYLLGPLKSRLHREMGTSNSQFSLLIASFK